MTTEIFVLGGTKNPAVQKRALARWMIVCALSSGKVEKRDGVVCLENATTKRAVLVALSQALQRFNKAAVLKIYISDDYVRNSLVNGWTMKWKQNNWHKIRYNGQLAHQEQWKMIQAQLAKHAVAFAQAEELDNQYIKEMEWRNNHVRN